MIDFIYSIEKASVVLKRQCIHHGDSSTVIFARMT